MADMWNLWDVKPPPVCSVKTALHFKGISDLIEVTFNAFMTLKNLNHLDREAAVLSRFLYKNRRIFRHDKGMQILVKMNQCLKKYLKLDMSSALFTFKQALPHNLKQSSTVAYLPTKQMLKWVLLKLQAFSQLFVRLTDLAKETGMYIYKKLCLGWSLNLSLLIFSMTARILTTSKFLVAKSIEWYASFYKCLPYLRETADFLSDYNFPVDLKLWLGKVDLRPLKKKTFADEVLELIDLANDGDEKEEEEDSDTEVKIVNEKLLRSLVKEKVTEVDSDIEEIVIEDTKKERKGMKLLSSTALDEDLGVPVVDDINGSDSDGDEEETKGKKEHRAFEKGWKKFKKKKGGRRVKWLKKMGKTVEKYNRRGVVAKSVPKSGCSVDSSVSYLTID